MSATRNTQSALLWLSPAPLNVSMDKAWMRLGSSWPSHAEVNRAEIVDAALTLNCWPTTVRTRASNGGRGNWQGQRSLAVNQIVHVWIGLDKQRKKCGVNAFIHACKLDIFAA